MEKLIIDIENSICYNANKLTREGLRLGSRMGVGDLLRIPLPLGLAYFFSFCLRFSIMLLGSFFISSTIKSIVCCE